MNRIQSLVGLCLASLALVVGGCGGSDAPAPEGAGASASSSSGGSSTPVIVDGSSTVYGISLAAQEAYDSRRPGSRIVVDYHGTGGGFGRYIQGEVDIVDASRAAKPEEEAKAMEKGFDWTRFTVGHDGITIVTHPSNDFATSLTVDQLKRLFQPESTVKTWKELDPAWPDRPIVLYTPDDDSGTFEFFTEAVVGKAKAQRKDVQMNSDDNILVNGVANDKDGLGYFGYAYFVANKDKLRAVPIRKDAESPPVEPSPETIHSGSYTPLSRPLYIYVKNKAFQRPEVSNFVSFYLENAANLAETAKYVSPTESERTENTAAFKKVDGSGSPETN